MSDINIQVLSGQSKRLLTGGKYCPSDIVVTAESGSRNLFDLSNAKYAAHDSRGLLFKPKIENGIFYSGGQSGNTRGCVVYVYVSPGQVIRLKANVSGETGTIEALAFPIPNVDSIFSSFVLLSRNTVNLGQIDRLYVIPEGCTCFGFAAYGATKYAMQLTDIEMLLEAGTEAEQAAAYAILTGDAV